MMIQGLALMQVLARYLQTMEPSFTSSDYLVGELQAG